MAKEEAKFIGIAALEEIATKYSSQIAMGGVHFRPDVYDRMRIKVISGLQYKDVKNVMNRKGHTTVRKVVGGEVKNTIGFLEERKMVGHLAWNHYVDNKDNYIEKAIVSGTDNVSYTYPMSELAFLAAVANYGEDLFDCLWHGDENIADDPKLANYYLRLYTGFITYLNKDVALGRISAANKNLVKIGTIEAPADKDDIAPWLEVEKFRNGWLSNLRNAKEVLIYCSDITGAAIASAYSNKNNAFQSVNYLDNGNFRVREWANVEFCPEPSFGVGDKLIATVPENFEYGVDTLDSRTSISVRVGSDTDHSDISFQVQSIQGTRVVNVNGSHFCMTDGPLVANDCAGDYVKDTFTVQVNDAKMGAVTVNDGAPDNTLNYVAGTILTLKATATEGHEFVAWSNGQTTTQIQVVTKGQPEGIIAIFKKTI